MDWSMSSSVRQESNRQFFLPPLREELKLLSAAPNRDGSLAWMVQDPVSNSFFRIGWLDFEMLLRWAYGSPEKIVNSVNSETTLDIEVTDVNDLKDFLEQNMLLQANNRVAVDQLRSSAKEKNKGLINWILHHYLFFRIPLFRPQIWLAKVMPWLDWIFTRTTAVVITILSLAGVFLVTRQWEAFSSTFVDQLTWSGLLGYTVALVFAKALHEMGHAITATRYGVRVAHMGVALLVMFPMLYTDTSESWKLSNPRQRLAIAGAGIITELALAGLATLAWSLSPEGSVKSALFFLATTSWLLTLLVNVSPFLRFDGYFILSDALDYPNLHQRSGEFARIWLRRILLGFDDEWPEDIQDRSRVFLILFAYMTWIYRLVVFFGLAVLVYYFFFKVLGIFLMAVELVWFIWRPFWSELSVWRERKSEIKTSRIWLAYVLLGTLLVLFLLPWQTGVRGPGWVHPERSHVLYSPLPGRIVRLPESDNVINGQPLFILESPDLQLSAMRARGLAQARANELIGLMGLPDGEGRREQVQAQKEKYTAEERLFQEEQARLEISAPFSGTIVDLDSDLAPGVWIQPSQPLATLVDYSGWVVDAYIHEEDIHRINPGDKARVYMPLRLEVLQGQVIEVDATRTIVLPHYSLSAKSGGDIVTLENEENAPRDAIYRVRVRLDKPSSESHQMKTGNVVISGEAKAWLPAILKRISAVVVRESGF
jgi:putative peptide zinc metalloprotease protein